MDDEDEICNCSDCRYERDDEQDPDYEQDEDTEWKGDPRSWCSACNSRENHFLEDQEIYVCDCSAAALLDKYGAAFPIILAHPLPATLRKPAYV
jgi:hypothetical protein